MENDGKRIVKIIKKVNYYNNYHIDNETKHRVLYWITPAALWTSILATWDIRNYSKIPINRCLSIVGLWIISFASFKIHSKISNLGNDRMECYIHEREGDPSADE